MDWFLYDNGLRHERVYYNLFSLNTNQWLSLLNKVINKTITRIIFLLSVSLHLQICLFTANCFGVLKESIYSKRLKPVNCFCKMASLQMFHWFINKPQKSFVKGKYYAIESGLLLLRKQFKDFRKNAPSLRFYQVLNTPLGVDLPLFFKDKHYRSHKTKKFGAVLRCLLC